MQDQSPWVDCPSGAVTTMADQLRRQRRQAQLRPIIAIGVAVLIFSAIGYGLTNPKQPGSQSGLTCRETVPLLVSYHDESLEANAAKDVRDHLSHCPMCRKHFEEMYPNEVRAPSSASHELLAFASNVRR
ncbi:MAG: zf-HC2 domain-containing protein [Planctomycetes bacterium]|nr:zf-HC2 domain-containing protein [Planctomycetota bacterium]